MTDIISTPCRLVVALYGAEYHTNAITALDDGSCCMIYPAVPHTRPMDSRKAGRKVACVWCTSTLHAPQWWILPRNKVGRAACNSFQASPHHVLRSPPMLSPAQWQSNRKPERTKKSYSLDINAITTRLHTAAQRRAVKRFPTRLFYLGQRTSRCVAPRSAQDLSLIFWWHYWYFG